MPELFDVRLKARSGAFLFAAGAVESCEGGEAPGARGFRGVRGVPGLFAGRLEARSGACLCAAGAVLGVPPLPPPHSSAAHELPLVIFPAANRKSTRLNPRHIV